MSVIMFAGASQFVALELFRSGASPVVVIATTLLINLRHLLMAASLRPHFGDRPLPTRLGLAYLLTDEAFAMATSWYRRGGRSLASADEVAEMPSAQAGLLQARAPEHLLPDCDMRCSCRDDVGPCDFAGAGDVTSQNGFCQPCVVCDHGSRSSWIRQGGSAELLETRLQPGKEFTKYGAVRGSRDCFVEGEGRVSECSNITLTGSFGLFDKRAQPGRVDLRMALGGE